MSAQERLTTSGSYVLEPSIENARDDYNGYDLSHLLLFLRVRWKIIAVTAFVVVALAVGIISQLTPLYTANAVVMLDQRKNNVADVSEVLSGLPTDPTSIRNQVEILTSRNLAGRVIDKLKLMQDGEFNPDAASWSSFLKYLHPRYWLPALPKPEAGGPHVIPVSIKGMTVNLPDMNTALKYINPRFWFPGLSRPEFDAKSMDLARNAAIDKFLSRIAVEPIGLSTAMKVSFASVDPEKAARICNSIADEYVEDQLNAKFEATKKTTQWLSDRIQELSRQAQAADAAVQQYKAVNNITETSAGVSTLDQQIGDLNGQIIAANSALAEKKAIYDRVEELARTGHAADVSQVVASPLIAQLRSQEVDLARQEGELATKYGPRHPKMLDIKSQMGNLGAKIGEETHRVIQSLASDVSVAQAHTDALKQSLEQLEAQSMAQNKSKVQLGALESSAKSARAMYEAFMARLNETRGQEGIQSADARVISRAEMPSAPSYPNKKLAAAVITPGALFLGLLLAFVIEKFDYGFRTAAQVEAMAGYSVLATVPEVRNTGGLGSRIANMVVKRPMSSYAEAIRGLQLSLMLTDPERKPKVVAVTSAVPNEGKTTLAVSLARTAARGGAKVIVLDCDTRQPAVAEVAGCRHWRHGLTEVLSARRSLEQCVIKDANSSVVILPCQKGSPSPGDIMNAGQMQELVGALRSAFDLVIIDSPPILPVNDAKVLARLADAVVFVVRWEKTPRDAVVSAIRSLRDIHASIAGVALSRADSKRFRYYSYGYQDYSFYNKYYGS